MHRLRAEYQGKVDVVSVNPRSGQGQQFARQYGTVFTPSFIFARADGSVQNVILGDADEERLRQELDSLLKSSQ